MKVAMLAALVLVILMANTAMASPETIEYQVIIEDNGNSIVIITINGSGLFQFPLQDDVIEIYAEGALYIIENNVLEVSIGSTEKAVVAYQTSMLTSKESGVWSFGLQLAVLADKSVTVAMPENTMITGTTPQALIESGEIMKLHWSGDLNEVSIQYYFRTDGELSYASGPFDALIYIIPAVVVVVLAAYLASAYRGRRMSVSRRESIIRTLSDNEKLIISALIENGGEMKRSLMERKTNISKSSLAASLRNLERKKILGVDRTYASHYIKFTEWFNGL